MTWWMLVLGGVLIAVTTYDLIATSVSSSTRSGVITSAVTKLTWEVLGVAIQDDDSPLLRAAGPVTVALTIGVWLAALWLGWSLVFAADIDAVVGSISSRPADLRGRFLFAAYTVYSLGYGNYVPTGAWEIVSAIALLNGLSAATLAITYAIPVVTAVTDRRRQAAVISTAGTSVDEIVATVHDANGFGALDQLLVQITPEIVLTGQRHLTYPVIHHFRGADRPSAFPASVAALDDAVTLVDVAVTGPGQPNAAFVRMWRRAVEALLDLVDIDDPDVGVPPLPSLEILDRLGIERVDEDEYRRLMEQHAPRRRRLHGFVTSARWSWPAGR